MKTTWKSPQAYCPYGEHTGNRKQETFPVFEHPYFELMATVIRKSFSHRPTQLLCVFHHCCPVESVFTFGNLLQIHWLTMESKFFDMFKRFYTILRAWLCNSLRTVS